jgi:hypothetical protein
VELTFASVPWIVKDAVPDPVVVAAGVPAILNVTPAGAVTAATSISLPDMPVLGIQLDPKARLTSRPTVGVAVEVSEYVMLNTVRDEAGSNS